MKRKSKKKQFKKKRIEKGSKKTSIVPLLLFIGLLSLFSETMRTIPAGAISENFFNMPYELPKLNSTLVEKKYLNNTSLINQKINYQNSKNNTFLIEENFSVDEELLRKLDE